MTYSGPTVDKPLDLDALRRDLVDEQSALDDLVTGLSDDEWHRATPSVGWTVADQIGHLAYFDSTAATAITNPDAFRLGVDELVGGATRDGVDAFTLGAFRRLSTKQQLATWRRARSELSAAALALGGETRVPWYGPSMGARSFLGARLMETWAHGADVAETLNVERRATGRLRHVAQLGFITRKWSYLVRGEEPPTGDVRLALTGPSGDLWTWGRDDADDSITGPAEEFCLVATQRRHVEDTSLETGALGYHWLVRAQAFAGAATDGPKPRIVE
ncbi:MAG: TIGR03084 family metal-binding protein [Acidimicrobiales bacterium]